MGTCEPTRWRHSATGSSGARGESPGATVDGDGENRPACRQDRVHGLVPAPQGAPPRHGRRVSARTRSEAAGPRRLLTQLGPVAAGLVVLGLGSFGYLSIAGRALGPVDFAPLATLWVLFNTGALAFYQPIEQELSRETANRLSSRLGARPVVVRCLIAGATMTAVLAALGLTFAGPLSDQAFNGERSLVPLLLVGLVGLFAEHVMRGVFSGTERFGRYGWQLTLDGMLRLLAPLAVVLLTVGTTTSLAAALVLAPLVAAVVTADRRAVRGDEGPPLPWRVLLPALGTLVGAAVLSQLIINAAPLAAQLLSGPEDADQVGVFIAALVMTRIPLFFFGAVQAAFLPALARLVGAGDRSGFIRQTRAILFLVAAGGGAFVLGLAAVGPWVLRLLYGPEFVAGRGILVVLGLGAAAYMAAQALAQTLIATRAYRRSLTAWALGSAVFFAVLLVPLEVQSRVAGALLAGGIAAAAAMALHLIRVVDEFPARAVDPS